MITRGRPTGLSLPAPAALATLAALAAILTTAAIGWLAAGAASAQEAESATAKLEPGLLGVGQIATLTLKAQGSGLKDLQLDPQFSLQNFEIVSGPMQSQSWQFANGRTSRSESLIWRLRAKEAGAARVSQITLKVNDSVFELPDQTLQVQKDPIESSDRYGRRQFGDPFENFPFSRRRRPQRSPSDPELFLRAEATPRKPFVGQQVLYTLYLFTQADVGSINPEQLPGFEGFWVEDIPQPKNLEPEMVDIQGKRYGRVVLLRKAIFPRRPGRVELEPVRARLVASMPDYSWLGSVVYRRSELYRTSNAVTIDVKPLPETPAGFRGAVGKLELSARLEPQELRLGEAATLTVTLEGQGNIQGVLEPELPVLDGVRVYPPEQSSRSRVSGTRVHGEKSWKYVLVPDRAGNWEIPPLSIDYFDPYEPGFRVAEARPITLTALAPLASIPTIEISDARGSAPSPVPNLVIGAEPSEPSPGWHRKPLVLGGTATLIAALLILPVVRLLRGRSQSRRRLCERLRRASTLRHGRRAADALESAWRDFLEERFEIPAGGVAQQWPQRLRTAGLKPAGLAELRRLVEDLEYLRCAPELSASESLIAELVARSLKLARTLR